MTDINNSEIEIVLCIPGPWASRSELIEQIAKKNNDYLFAGMLLMNTENQHSCELQFEDADDNMVDAFNAAGYHWRDTPEMERIASHQSVVYLISDGGSVESAHAIMESADALIKAGGFGVKVESTGLAHKPKDWSEQCKYKNLFKSHTSYVVYINSENIHSCGMHNFGLPDAIVDEPASDNSAELLRIFTLYLLSESPEIQDGQTFSIDADSPKYTITQYPSIDYGGDSLFNNPHGMWMLKPC